MSLMIKAGTDCGHGLMRLCPSDCPYSVRYCSPFEDPWDKLKYQVTPGLCGLLLASVLVGCLLQWLSDYAKFCLFTKWLFCGRGYIHRSIMFDHINDGDCQRVELMLKHCRVNPADLNRPNAQGRTVLHEAILAHQDAISAMLISYGANPSARDYLGETPLDMACMTWQREILEVMWRKHPNLKSCKIKRY